MSYITNRQKLKAGIFYFSNILKLFKYNLAYHTADQHNTGHDHADLQNWA